MCLAVPGKIVSIITGSDQALLRMAEVSFAGIKKQVCLDFLPDAKPGDYVIVHAGFALSKVDEEEAEETLRIIIEEENIISEEIKVSEATKVSEKNKKSKHKEG